MTSFLGCIPEQMHDLNDTIQQRAERIRSLLEGLGVLSGAVGWTGPDADAFRESTAGALAEGTAVAALLAGRGRELVLQADAQDAASAPDRGADLSGIRMGPPGGPSGPPAPGPGGPGGGGGPDARPPRERLEDIVREGIGGPLAASPEELQRLREGYARLREHLAQPPGGGDLLTEGELAYDPEHLATAESLRTLALRKVPVVGQLQGAHAVQGRLEDAADGAERWLVENGHGQYVPALHAATSPLAVTGALIGEESIVGQSLRGLDQSIANRLQTAEGVVGGIREGDAGEVARELEYGMLREVENTSLLLLPDPSAPILGAGEELLGTAAEASSLIGPPPLTAVLEDAHEGVGDLREHMAYARGTFTDPQQLLRMRREHAPMPWDPEPTGS